MGKDRGARMASIYRVTRALDWAQFRIAPKTPEELRSSGVKSGAGGTSAESVARHLQLLLSAPKEQALDDGEETKKPDKVYLVEGLPPLPRKTVEKIHRGEFVEFADFPLFDGGRKEGEWSAERSVCEQSSPHKHTGETRKKGPREVPDVSWWGTCFTLYERARVEAKPELAKQLAAYREAIVETARRHRWEHVARYDRCFRLAAAGKPDVEWDRMDAALLVREIASPSAASNRAMGFGGRGSLQSAGASQKRERKQHGACFRFNRQNGACTFGHQCRFAHICSTCGGEHPATQCPSRAVAKSQRQEAGNLL